MCENFIKEIAKLKAEYDVKIANCDKLIDTQRKTLRRMLPSEQEDALAILIERSTEQAKRQAYVQAKMDIDSLLDCTYTLQ